MRLIRFLLKIFASILFLNLLIIGLLLAILQTNKGQEWAVKSIAVLLEKNTQMDLEIKKFHYSFPLKLRFEETTFFYENLPAIFAKEIDIACDFSKLWQGKIVLPSLKIVNLKINSFPINQKQAIKPASVSDLVLFPFYLKVEDIQIQRISLSSPAIEFLHLSEKMNQWLEGSSFNITGSLNNNPFKKYLTGHLSLSKDSDEFQLNLQIDKEVLSFSLQSSSFPIHLLPFDFPQGLTDPLKFSMDGTFEFVQNKRLMVKNVQMENGQGFYFNGNGAMTLKGLIEQFHFRGHLNNLEPIRNITKKYLSGDFSFDGQVTGDLFEPIFDVRLSSPAFIIENEKIQNLHATLTKLKSKKPFTLFHFEYLGTKWEVSSSIEKKNNEWFFSPFRLDALHSNLEGELSYSTIDSSIKGILAGTLSHLQTLKSFLPQDLQNLQGQGLISLEFIFSEKLKEIKAAFDGHSLRAQDVQAKDASIHFVLQNDKKTFNFDLKHIQGPDFQLTDLRGSGVFDPLLNRWPFEIQGSGFFKENFQLALTGILDLKHQEIYVEGKNLSGTLGKYPLTIAQPFAFIYHLKGISLYGVDLHWGQAAAVIEAHYKANGKIEGHFKTNEIPSDIIALAYAEMPIKGHASFQGELSGTIHEPEGHLDIQLKNIQSAEPLFLQKSQVDGSIQTKINRHGIDLEGNFLGIGSSPLHVRGHLPLQLGLEPFNIKMDNHLPFHLSVNAEGALDPYLQLFFHEAVNLSGYATIDLQLSGQMQEPQLSGKIQFSNGSFESLKTGTVYSNIQGTLIGEGKKFILQQFSAQDNNSGSLSAQGTLHIDYENKFPFKFDIQPSHVFIMDSDYAQISASGHLTLAGNNEKSKLSGELTVDEALVQLEQTLPQRYKSVDIQYFNLKEGETLPGYYVKPKSFLDLDIVVHANKNAIIRSSQLESSWTGSVNITGTPDTPLLFGNLRLSQGEYDLRGKIFTLTQGNIHFGGSLEKKTSIYVIASKELDKITADIIVKGPANKPVLSFRSNPPLSQREVLSYILFNRGISDISPDEGNQLSESFISLNAESQGKYKPDFITRLRKNIGLDIEVFDMPPKKEDDYRELGLQVGKRLSDKLTVSVKQGVISLSPVITVEAKVSKNIRALAESGVVEDAPIRLMLKWKKDY